MAAFVIEQGGPTSHTAILARAHGRAGRRRLPGGHLDEPEARRCWWTGPPASYGPRPADAEVGRRRRTPPRRGRPSCAAASGPGATADGHAVPLLANIGGPRDVAAALEHGAEGIGLFRTEFLFLDRADRAVRQEQDARLPARC